VLPHSFPSGPVAVAAHVQLGMCVANWELQEHAPQDAPHFTDLVDHVIQVRDGYLLPPDRPGLGIELDIDGLARHPPTSVDLSHTPRREDGSVAIR
jgi:galactonate dehydratase